MASITQEEVAKHNKADDAWIIVDGDVYDVTKFAGVHPGGTQILLEYAGKDATEDFYALHRLEVLDKYQRLKKGRLADAKGPAPKKASEVIQEFSKVPFAEPSYLQGFKSPYFNESHVKLRQEARKFFAGESMEEALECEAKSTAPSKEMRKRMGDLGLIAMVQGPGPHLKIPSSLCGGVVKPEEFTYFHEMVVQEERCRTMCPGYEDGLDGAVSIGLPVLLKYGSDWMKNDVVPPIIKGDQTCVLSITEAFAGSDVAGLRTTAVLDASGENYIVNGTKKWITGGMYADWFVTAVRTGKTGAGGISMMLIPRSDAVQTKIMKSKYSSAAGTAYVTYENCIVPKKYLIGTENKGFQIIMSNFNHERWMITETFKWAMQRKVFGKPLIEQPVIREKLAQMFAGVETCTQMLYDITYNMVSFGSQGAEVGARIALLKYQTTRMNHLVADNAVQVLGGRGVTQTGMGRVVEVFSRMYKIPAVYGGSAVEPNPVACSALMNACEKGRQWQQALALLEQMPQLQVPPDNFSYSACISALRGRWQMALALLAAARRRLRGNEVTYNAAITACANSRWDLAGILFTEMLETSIRPGLVTQNAFLSALGSGSAWEHALSFFGRIRDPDEVTCSAAICAFEGAGLWEGALWLLFSMPQMALQANQICYGASIAACEKGSQWAMALELLELAQRGEMVLDETSVNAAISACEVCGQRQRALFLLHTSELTLCRRSGTAFLWALARLQVDDAEVIHAALGEAVAELKGALDGEALTRGISRFWWSLSMLGARPLQPSAIEAVATVPPSSWQLFTPQELLMSTWGAIDAPEVLWPIQDEWTRRLDRGAEKDALTTWLSQKDYILGSLWACSFAGQVRSDFLAAVKGFTRSAGRQLDEDNPAPVDFAAATSPGLPKGSLETMETPQLLRFEGEQLLIFKPTGWEVEDPDGEQSLGRFLLQHVGRRPIFRDRRATFGFLHRLDVPSSGLILAASSYTAYFDLRLQLAQGRILRDYLVLCHGFRASRVLAAAVTWSPGTAAPSRAGRGKPSGSRVQRLGMGYVGAASVSLLAVRILTGRRHQIRVHLAHVGCPTVNDALYSSAAVHAMDQQFCRRNMLHRHHLSFTDHQGVVQDFTVPLPPEMAEPIRQISPKEPGSLERLRTALNADLSLVGSMDWKP
eukprot:s3661_g2.t1